MAKQDSASAYECVHGDSSNEAKLAKKWVWWWSFLCAHAFRTGYVSARLRICISEVLRNYCDVGDVDFVVTVQVGS
jgi:hypothetical protein